MAGNISQLGITGFSGTFGWENNELHLKVWLNDPKNQFLSLLEKVYGTGSDPKPLRFPEPFQTFTAYNLSFDCKSTEKGAQGDTDTAGDFSLLDSFPTIRGGLSVDIAYRPSELNGYEYIIDEQWDYTSQTMSLIGNKYGNKVAPLKWSDDKDITNLAMIVKLIPKIDFVQRRIFVKELPNAVQTGLIGAVNAAPLTLGASSSGSHEIAPIGTALLVGMPMIRRWRFDGFVLFEVGVKMALNYYQDKLEDGSTGYVTWNRLWRPYVGDSGESYWDRVKVGTDGRPLYREEDLSQVMP